MQVFLEVEQQQAPAEEGTDEMPPGRAGREGFAG